MGLGAILYEGLGNTIRVSLSGDPVEEIVVAKKILSSLNIRREGFDIVSCPTCARTNIDIVGISDKFEKEINNKKFLELLKKSKKNNYKIAIMGCVVNGPGEAHDADIGIAGGNGEAILFKKGSIVKKIKEKDIIKILLNEVERDLR